MLQFNELATVFEINLESESGNVFVVLGIIHQIERTVKGVKSADDTLNRLIDRFSYYDIVAYLEKNYSSCVRIRGNEMQLREVTERVNQLKVTQQ